MRSPIKVLIAEDELLIALALEAALHDLGYDVVGVASTAPEAVEMAARKDVGLAVIDVRLADGTDGLWAVRRIIETRGIPVVVCSACAKASDAHAAGAGAFLPKPYTAPQLISALESVFPADHCAA